MKINVKNATVRFYYLAYGAVFYDPESKEYCMKINHTALDNDDEVNAVCLKDGKAFSMPPDAEIVSVNAEMTVDR